MSERSERTGWLSSVSERDEILARLATTTQRTPIPRYYRRTGETDPDRLAALLTDRLLDYGAGVHPCGPDGCTATVGRVLADVTPLAVPPDVPEDWLTAYNGQTTSDPMVAAAVLTGCALAIAETGTFVLDAGPAQGRRALSLLPDHHVCVIHIGQIVATVPEALARLDDPTRPLTFVSGPSATSDIELNRVEGVHGPRHLDVILVR